MRYVPAGQSSASAGAVKKETHALKSAADIKNRFIFDLNVGPRAPRKPKQIAITRRRESKMSANKCALKSDE